MNSPFDHGNKLSSEAWQGRYLNAQTGWDRGAPNPALIQWLDTGQLTPCRILVPGCGRGHEVIELARRGFEVTAVDFAAEPIRHLRSSLSDAQLNANIIQQDLFEFAPDQPFDAIYEQTCLCAIDPTLWKAYEDRLQQWVKPGGDLFALFMQTGGPEGPPFHCDLAAMRTLFDDARWQWPDGEAENLHPTGLREVAVKLTRRIETTN